MFRKIWGLCVLILLLSFSFLPSFNASAQDAGSAEDTTVEECIERGKFFYNLGMWELAISNFDQAIKLDRDNVEAHYTRGNVYHNLGELEHAIEDYSRTLELDPDFAPALSDRGTAYFDMGMIERALADFNKALRLDANYLNACTGRGLAYIAQGDNEAAVADFDHALEIDPVNALAWFNRGYANFEWGKYREAIEDFTQSIVHDPNCENQCELDHYNRGNAYLQLGDYVSAIADYTESIHANSSFALPYQNRGLVYAEQGKTELALADLNEYVRLNGGKASTAIRLTMAELERANAVLQPGEFDAVSLLMGVVALLAGVDLLIHFRPDPETTTASPEILRATRTRGTALTILLILGILSGLSTTINYWFGSYGIRLRHAMPWLNDAEWIPVAFGLVGVLIAVSALAMWNWRKWGFYLLIAVSLLNGLVLIALGLPVLWAFVQIIVIDLIWGRLRKQWIYFT